MKIKSAEFETSAPTLRSCPARPLPEFAFIGRSNVGKSSLVNMLTNRRNLARISNTPGKTQVFNFFVINEAWRLVDLPGYGFAKVGQQERYQFSQSVAEFLSKRELLRRVFVLIDSRIAPQPIDLDFIRWIHGIGMPFTLVFTKVDKHSATQARASVERFVTAARQQGLDIPDVLMSSAENGAGKAEILASIAADLGEP